MMIKLNLLAFTLMLTVRKTEKITSDWGHDQRLKAINDRNLDRRAEMQHYKF